MANRETFPASLFPLRGDLFAEAGAITVEVIGLQNIPFSAAPTLVSVPTYNPITNTIDWDVWSGDAVEINGIGVSADKQIFINAVSDGAAPAWVIEVNGAPA